MAGGPSGALERKIGNFGSKFGRTAREFAAEALSYDRLMKSISINHPADPDTKQKFSIYERFTIKDYAGRLSDICFCHKIGRIS